MSAILIHRVAELEMCEDEAYDIELVFDEHEYVLDFEAAVESFLAATIAELSNEYDSARRTARIIVEAEETRTVVVFSML